MDLNEKWNENWNEWNKMKLNKKWKETNEMKKKWLKWKEITRNSVLYFSALRTCNYQGAGEIRDM
jgi:hypothetical protein